MQFNIGIAGAGNFARFAGNIFRSMNVNVVAIMDNNKEAIAKLSSEWNIKGYDHYEEFLESGSIDLVYIATPPYLHYQQSKIALLNGKHVICEKPAALHAREAAELKELADSLQLLWVVNLMQRYNPLYQAVKKIIDEKVLGDFLHGNVENYASDEDLDREHWFWDETKSGGIFIEHGVHFFDMFTGWLGNGKVLHAVEMIRPGSDLADRVQATVDYNNALVNFYHGFDQPKLLDRLEIKLLFEKGDIVLYEWIPVKIKIHGLLSGDEREKLDTIAGYFTTINEVENNKHHGKGRGKEIRFNKLYSLEQGNIGNKMIRYEELIKRMLDDQLSWISNRQHRRVIDGLHAVESLQVAEEAKKTAKLYSVK